MQDSVLKIGDIRLLCRQHFEQTGDKLSFYIHATGWRGLPGTAPYIRGCLLSGSGSPA